MKFVSVRDLRLKPGRVWEMAKKEKDVIITDNGQETRIAIYHEFKKKRQGERRLTGYWLA